MKDRTESKVETAKKNSRFLEGGLTGRLADTEATHFEKDDTHVLKFHGVYQQDDRDQRKDRQRRKLDKDYRFMVRLALPGGTMTAGQYLAMDRLADAYANGSLRLTTRQGLQLHGVLKGDLKPVISEINQELLTTLGACGDVERNVMACPAPFAGGAHRTVRRLAAEIASELRPQTSSYHEIWIDGEKQVSSRTGEPFYGESYLPRKFKTGVVLETDNCLDIYSHDCGLVACLDEGEVAGYNLLVGGGMGLTHQKPETFAALAQPLGFIRPEEALPAVRSVAAIFRDRGNRLDRRQARLKYLIARWGIERFRRELRRRSSLELLPLRPLAAMAAHDHLGAHSQGDGKWFLGVFIENGRIADRSGRTLKSALRRIVERYRPGVRATAQQNLLLTGLGPEELKEVRDHLREQGVAAVEDLSPSRRSSMACPALPTCGLALGEAERLLPSVIDEIEAELRSIGLGDRDLAIRMTGCPNGCARPYTADLAFVARSPNAYNIYVGGSLEGDRMADLFAASISPGDFLETLRPLLRSWARHSGAGEGLGDYYRRLTGRGGRRKITGREEAVGATLFAEGVA